MCGAGIVADGKSGRVGNIDQAGKFSAAHEVDRNGAHRADFRREKLLAGTPDNDRENIGGLEQPPGQLAIAGCRPTLRRVARRRAGNQDKEAPLL